MDVRGFILFVLVAVAASAQLRLFTFRPVHAAFSRPLNRIVMTSTTPDQLHLFDPATGNDTVLPLPGPPTALSISPDGLTAAVGHASQITYFQLSSATLLRTLPATAPVRELLLAPPSLYADLGPDNVRSFAVAGGAVTDPIPGLTALNSPQLSPDGRTLYSAGNNTLDRIDLLTSVVSRSALNHCGRILLSADGGRLYTACGVAYLNTPNLPYAGTILSTSTPSLLAGSTADLIAISNPQSNNSSVQLFNESHLRRVGQLRPQPLVLTGGTTLTPQWLFLDATGTRVHTISFSPRSAQETELTLFGVDSTDLTARPANCIFYFGDNDTNFPGAIRRLGSEGGLVSMVMHGQHGCVYFPTSTDPWITISNPLISTAASVLLVHIAPNPNPRLRTGNILASGMSFSISQEGSGATPTRHHFSYRVSQSAYSRSLDRLILTSDTPNALHIFNPVTRADQTIALARPPTSVAVRPDGQFAAVGHDAGISLVNLQTAAVETFLPAPLEVATLAFSANNILFAYPSPNRGTPVSLNLSNRATSPLPAALPTSVMRLSPDGATLASAALSIERWTTNNASLNLLATPPAESCGDLWFTHSGSRLLTACGTSVLSSDLSINNRINGRIRAADHSPTRGTTAALTANADGFQSDQLALIPDSTQGVFATNLAPFESAAIGDPAGRRPFPLKGRFLAWSADESRIHIVSEIANNQYSVFGTNWNVFESFSTQATCVSRVEVDPTRWDPPVEGQLFPFVAAAPAECLWQASSSASWVRILTGGSYIGRSRLFAQALPNLGIAPREAVLNVGGIALRVSQPGQPLELSPNTLSVGATPGAVAIRITTAAPTFRWTVDPTASPWIKFGQTSGVGSADLNLMVAPNVGPPRVGTFHVNGIPFTLAQDGLSAFANQPPIVLPAVNSAGNAVYASRSFRFADPDGVADLAILNVLINTALDGRGACHIAYDIRASLLYLVATNGVDATTSAIGTPGALSNGRCRINTETVQFTRESNSVTLTVGYEFVSFPGNVPGQAIYAAARDRQGNNSGWQLIGHHNFGLLTPMDTFIALPSLPTASSPLTVSYTRVFGAPGSLGSADFKVVQVLVQSALDGRRACYLGFDHDNNLLYLMNDEGTRLLPSAVRLNGAPGSVPFVENSQCRITAQGSTFTDLGSVLTLTLNIAYQPAFAGPRLVYGGAQTPTANSGWQILGFLAVPVRSLSRCPVSFTHDLSG